MGAEPTGPSGRVSSQIASNGNPLPRARTDAGGVSPEGIFPIDAAFPNVVIPQPSKQSVGRFVDFGMVLPFVGKFVIPSVIRRLQCPKKKAAGRRFDECAGDMYHFFTIIRTAFRVTENGDMIRRIAWQDRRTMDGLSGHRSPIVQPFGVRLPIPGFERCRNQEVRQPNRRLLKLLGTDPIAEFIPIVRTIRREVFGFQQFPRRAPHRVPFQVGAEPFQRWYGSVAVTPEHPIPVVEPSTSPFLIPVPNVTLVAPNVDDPAFDFLKESFAVHAGERSRHRFVPVAESVQTVELKTAVFVTVGESVSEYAVGRDSWERRFVDAFQTRRFRFGQRQTPCRHELFTGVAREGTYEKMGKRIVERDP